MNMFMSLLGTLLALSSAAHVTARIGEYSVQKPGIVSAEAFKGSDLGEKISAAINALGGPGVIDASTIQGDLRIKSPLKITKPITLRLPAQTVTCTMRDPGAASGCIDVVADGVTLEGVPGRTVITQPNAQNIQNAIHIGRSKHFAMRGLTINWNESHQQQTTQYYTGIRSAAGASDIRIEDNEFTACGDRCIDLRGTSHSWIIHNYFHQTGIDVGGRGQTGNAISVDVDGNTSYFDTWILDNIAEEWGDSALACPHGSYCHVVGNTVRGRLDFGRSPSKKESGIDFVGCSNCDAVGNRMINVALFNLNAEAQAVGAITYIPTEVRVVGNEFSHNLGAGFDPLVNVGASLAPAQLRNITFANNKFNGVRLALADVDHLTMTGNSFTDVCTMHYSSAVVMSQSTGSLRNITITSNVFSTTNGSLKQAFLATPALQSLGSYLITHNDVEPAIAPIKNLSHTVITIR